MWMLCSVLSQCVLTIGSNAFVDVCGVVNGDSSCCWEETVELDNSQISISSHSDCYSESRCAEETLDGITCWNDGGLDVLWRPGTEGYIIYDMGEDRAISSVTIWNQNEYNSCQRHITGFDLYYSDSPDTGFTIAAQPRDIPCFTSSNAECPNPDVHTVSVDGGNSARYWQLYVPDECKPSGDYFGIMEISFSAAVNCATGHPAACSFIFTAALELHSAVIAWTFLILHVDTYVDT